MSGAIARLIEYLRVGSPAWAVRRRLTLAIILVAFFVILFQVVWGTDTPRVLGLVGLMVDTIKWVMTTYVAAATTETAVQTLRAAQPPPATSPAGGAAE